jgi:hypothetical protein
MEIFHPLSKRLFPIIHTSPLYDDYCTWPAHDVAGIVRRLNYYDTTRPWGKLPTRFKAGKAPRDFEYSDIARPVNGRA